MGALAKVAAENVPVALKEIASAMTEEERPYSDINAGSYYRYHIDVPEAVLLLFYAGKIKQGPPLDQIIALWKYLHDARLGMPIVLDKLWGAERYGLTMFSPEP